MKYKGNGEEGGGGAQWAPQVMQRQKSPGKIGLERMSTS